MSIVGEVRDAAEARRQRRAHWPVRQFQLGEEPSDDLSGTTTPEERIAMVWPLTLDAFTLAPLGLPEPTPRSAWPIRVRPLGGWSVD